MKPIGGYFSLELMRGKAFHPRALALNTGRNCLEYVLRIRGYHKVFIPYYTCGVLLEPFLKLRVEYEFYHINQLFELAGEIELRDGEALLYTNYFGLKQAYVAQLAERYGKQLIIDNTQAFFAVPLSGIDTFYTCRKFFGVPDGAYLYTDTNVHLELEQDVSYDRMSFLLKRLDLGAEAGYADFREQSERLVGQPIKLMSNLTVNMMQGINYRFVAQRRRANYRFLYEYLNSSNQIKLVLSDDAVPMVFPYMTNNKTLKQSLILENVFVPTYWPNVFEWCQSEDWEYIVTESTIFLPIDQRYDRADMMSIINYIENVSKS